MQNKFANVFSRLPRICLCLVDIKKMEGGICVELVAKNTYFSSPFDN